MVDWRSARNYASGYVPVAAWTIKLALNVPAALSASISLRNARACGSSIKPA